MLSPRPVGSAMAAVALVAAVGCGRPDTDAPASAARPAPRALVVIDATPPAPAPVPPPPPPPTKPEPTPTPTPAPPPAPAPLPAPEPVPPPPVPEPTPPKPEPVPATVEPPAPAVPVVKSWPKEVSGKTLAEWLKETQSPDPAVRESAARIIPAFGPDARKPAVRDMVRLIGDPDPGVRMAALGTIGEMMFESRDDQKQVFDALRLIMNNSFPGSQARLYSVRAMALYGSDAALPLNITALDQLKTDSWWMTRQAVANALGRLGAAVYDDQPVIDSVGRYVPRKHGSEAAQKSLRYMLENDKSAAVRLEAAYALLMIGPPYTNGPGEYAKAVGPNVDAVAAALKKEKDKSVQVWLHVLRGMYDADAMTDAVQKVGAAMTSPDVVVRAQALQGAAMLGKDANNLSSAVREVLMGPDAELHPAAINALVAIAKEPARVVPDLEKFREKTKDEELKRLASQAIAGALGQKQAAPAKAADATKPMALGKP